MHAFQASKGVEPGRPVCAGDKWTTHGRVTFKRESEANAVKQRQHSGHVGTLLKLYVVLAIEARLANYK